MKQQELKSVSVAHLLVLGACKRVSVRACVYETV